MIKYLYDAFMALSILNKVMVIMMLGILTFTIVITILDYRSGAKHINKKEW